MAETPQSSPDPKDESMILRFRDERLVKERENTFEVPGSLVDLFAPAQKPPLKIHEPD